MLTSDEQIENRAASEKTMYLEVQKDLELWFQSLVGRALIASQRYRLNKMIERCYGVHQAEIGVSHRLPVGNASALGHKFVVIPRAMPDLPINTLVSSSSELALENESVDLVLLHHALDFSAEPHQTLREASRILKPSGYMAIVGFNPLSLWGAVRTIKRKKQGVWATRFISGHRLEDWLSLLDLRMGAMKYYFYSPPINSPAFIQKFSWLERVLNSRLPLGAYYIAVAKKQQMSRIRTSRSWRRKADVVGIPVANRASKQSDKPV